MRPMLATKSMRVPKGPAWLHEVKWDGMRVLVELRDGRLRLWSRNEKDVTVTFPELHALAGFGRDVLLDGEVVAFLDGLPVFGALADRMHVGNPTGRHGPDRSAVERASRHARGAGTGRCALAGPGDVRRR
jgi:bifunctional non-homologous end joining protein LigD